MRGAYTVWFHFLKIEKKKKKKVVGKIINCSLVCTKIEGKKKKKKKTTWQREEFAPSHHIYVLLPQSPKFRVSKLNSTI